MFLTANTNLETKGMTQAARNVWKIQAHGNAISKAEKTTISLKSDLIKWKYNNKLTVYNNKLTVKKRNLQVITKH